MLMKLFKNANWITADHTDKEMKGVSIGGGIGSICDVVDAARMICGKEGFKLEWQWRCKPSPDSKKTKVEVLDFLMNANIKLSVNKEKELIIVKSTAEPKQLAELLQKNLKRTVQIIPEKKLKENNEDKKQQQNDDWQEGL